MNNLWSGIEKLLPSYIEQDSAKYAVCPDFRNILRIFALIADEDIPEYKKAQKISAWFYADKIPPNPLKGFIDFINSPSPHVPQDHNAVHSEMLFCYDFDATEIYVSFIKEYSLDLLTVEFLHWYKFRLLLKYLSAESPFKSKIEIRFLNLSPYKGERLAEMLALKQSVQLPCTSASEDDEFESEWGSIGEERRMNL